MIDSKLILSEERVKKFKKNIRDEYDQASMIKRAVSFREAKPPEAEQFVQIGMCFYAKPEIFTESHKPEEPYTLPTIVGLGRNIALGEEKYLVEKLENSIRNRLPERSLSFEAISRAIAKVGSDFIPDAVFIPLDFFSMLTLQRVPKVSILYVGRDCFLVLGSRKMLVFWSSKYTPFDNLIFIDRRLGEWIVKSDPVDKHWVTIDVKSANEKVEVTVKTVACYTILDPEAGLILKVPPPKQEEKRLANRSPVEPVFS